MNTAANRVAWGLAFVILAHVCCFPALGQFDPSAYRPVTLKALATEYPEFLQDRTDNKATLFAVPFKHLIRASTSRTVHDIPAVRKKWIDDWARVASAPSAFIQLYRREVLVRMENQEFWIPIQELLLEPLAEELPKGGELDLYVLLAGAISGTWFFMVTEFQSVAPQR